MAVTQLSIFVENKRGRIAEVVGLLADNDISIFGFSVAEVSDYGIIRLLAENGRRAQDVLEGAGFTMVANSVISVPLADRAGSLASVVRLVSESGANIEYIYLSARRSVVMKVDDVGSVESTLRAAGFEPLDDEAVDSRPVT